MDCAAAEHTYVKVRCEGDRGRPIYATAKKEGEEDAAVFEDAVYIFIILHSDANFLIKVRDTKENRFYGQVGPVLFLLASQQEKKRCHDTGQVCHVNCLLVTSPESLVLKQCNDHI